jgi:hypothetical protein
MIAAVPNEQLLPVNQAVGGAAAGGTLGDEEAGYSTPPPGAPAMLTAPGGLGAHPLRSDSRYYRAWPGNNRFFCGGRVMLGPASDWPYNLCAWSSILIPSGAYFIFAVRTLDGRNVPFRRPDPCRGCRQPEKVLPIEIHMDMSGLFAGART